MLTIVIVVLHLVVSLGAHLPDPHALGQGRRPVGHVRWLGGAGRGRLDRGREEPRPHHDHRGDHLHLHHCDLGPAPAVTAGHAGGRATCPGAGDRWPVGCPRALRRHACPTVVTAAVVLCVVGLPRAGPPRAPAPASSRRTPRRRHASRPAPGAGQGGHRHRGARPGSHHAQRPHRGGRHRRRGACSGARSGPRCSGSGPGLTPQLDTNVVDSAEVISLSPQTVVYQIDPRAMWSDGVPISADDFTYAWHSQRGGATDIDGTPDSVASTLGYRDIAVAHGLEQRANRHRRVPHPLRRLGVAVRRPAARPRGRAGGVEPRLRPLRRRRLRVGRALAGACRGSPDPSIVLERNPRWWGSPPILDRVVVRAVSGSAALDVGAGPGPGAGRLPERVRPVVHGPGVVVPRRSQTQVGIGDAHAPTRVQRPTCAAERGRGPPGHRPCRRPGRHRRERGPAREPFGVGGQRPPRSQRRARLRRRRHRLREGRSGGFGASARAERVGAGRRTGTWTVARQAREPQPSCGQRTTRGRRRSAPSWPRSSWRRASTSCATPMPAAQLYGSDASHRRLRSRPRPRRRQRVSEHAGQRVLDVSGHHRRGAVARTGPVSTTRRSTRSSPRPCRSWRRLGPMPSTSRSTRRCGRPCRRCRSSPSRPCWCRRRRCQGSPTIPGGLGPLWSVRLWTAAIRGSITRRQGPAHAYRTAATLALECSMRWRRRTRRSGGIGRRASLRG